MWNWPLEALQKQAAWRLPSTRLAPYQKKRSSGILLVYRLAACDLPPGGSAARVTVGLFLKCVFSWPTPSQIQTLTHAWRRCPHTLTLQNPNSQSHSLLPNSLPNSNILASNLTHSRALVSLSLTLLPHSRQAQLPLTTHQFTLHTLQSHFLQHSLVHSTQVKHFSCALLVFAFLILVLLLHC